jgi:hypothetical protein
MAVPRKKQAPVSAVASRRTAAAPGIAQGKLGITKLGVGAKIVKPGSGRHVQREKARVVYDPKRRTSFVVEVLGNQTVASALRVNKSQPSRWKSGAEAPSDRAAAGLVDLDYVLARLLLVWDESVARDWLSTPNGFLDGASPLEVIEREGPLPVVEAIDAEASEAYA